MKFEIDWGVFWAILAAFAARGVFNAIREVAIHALKSWGEKAP